MISGCLATRNGRAPHFPLALDPDERHRASMHERDALTYTYDELVAKLGISRPAVKARARRAGRPRVIGNDRIARLRVPADAILAGLDKRSAAEAAVLSQSDVVDHLTELTKEVVRLVKANAALASELARTQERE